MLNWVELEKAMTAICDVAKLAFVYFCANVDRKVPVARKPRRISRAIPLQLGHASVIHKVHREKLKASYADSVSTTKDYSPLLLSKIRAQGTGLKLSDNCLAQ